MLSYWRKKLEEYNPQLEQLQCEYDISGISVVEQFENKFYLVVYSKKLNKIFSRNAEVIHSPFFLRILESDIQDMIAYESTH